MKFLAICAVVALICAHCVGLAQGRGLGLLSGIFGNHGKLTCDSDATPILRAAVDDFTVRLVNRIANYSNFVDSNFIISPYSIWLALTSIAEFSDKKVQSQFFQALNLPEQSCIRNNVYKLASRIEDSGRDNKYYRSRELVFAKEVEPNSDWIAFNEQYKTLGFTKMLDNEVTFANILESKGVDPKLPFNGNALVVDSLIYDGLWTSAFSNGIVEIAPFYNDARQVLGKVEYMKMKNRVRLAHIPIIDAKVLELPVGSDEKYAMLFTMGVKSKTAESIVDFLQNSMIVNLLKAFTVSLVPIDVAIPKFFMEYAFDARPALEDLGFGYVFTDPAYTRYLGEPSVVPSYFFQSSKVNVSNEYARPEQRIDKSIFNLFQDAASNVASAMGRDFIANKPFHFSLIEKKTGLTLFTGLYATPLEKSVR